MRRKTTIFHVKPAPGMSGRKLLVPFPPSQALGKKRYLHADGETVECHTSPERLWWASLVRTGDALVVEAADVSGEKFISEKPEPGPDPAPTPVPVAKAGRRRR
jgi:hypothetical protein